MRDLFIEIYGDIRRNKLRTVLTGFAVIWGILMLILLLGSGKGLLNGMMSNDREFMTNSMVVWGGQTSKPYKGLKPGRRIYLNSKDIEGSKNENLTNMIDEALGVNSLGYQLFNYNESYIQANITGVNPEYLTVEKKLLLAGRNLNRKDVEESRKVILVPEEEAINLLGGKGNAESLLGKYIRFGNLPFLVVGILSDDKMNSASECFIPFSTSRILGGYKNTVNNILLTFHGIETEKDIEVLEREYKKMIAANHDAAPDDNNVAYIWNRLSNSIHTNKALSIINTALWILGILTLLSGIVGVSNIMLITVKERTHEFGIRKAIGAKPSSIMKLIIAESIVITGFFGYIGMILGLIACEVLDKTLGSRVIDIGVAQVRMFKDPTVGLGTAVGVTVLMIVAGIIAGAIPARKAAAIKPIEALRAE